MARIDDSAVVVSDGLTAPKYGMPMHGPPLDVDDEDGERVDARYGWLGL